MFSKNIIKVWLKSIRGIRTLHWVLMVVLGIILRPDMPGIYDIFMPVLAVFFLWNYTTIVNDVYDMDIDRKAHPERPLIAGEISPADYRKMSLLPLLLAAIFSFLSGFIVLLTFIIYAILAVIYSKPPIRIRDRPYGTIIMGTASSIEVIAGYNSHFWLHDLIFFYTKPPSVLFFETIIVVLSALSIAPNITAYKDYDADMDAGVRTIYTIFGKEKGKRAMTVLLVFLFILPSFIFFSPLNFSLSLFAGIFSALLFYFYECAVCVFAAYFMEISYFLLFLLFFSFPVP